jgi:beta-glucosidase
MKRMAHFIFLSGLMTLLATTGLSALFQRGDEPAYLNPYLPIEERVADLVSRMTLEEKISQMVHDSRAIERLGIPEYNWWNEALHGVARNGLATVFPQAIGLAATWDTDLMYRISTVISDEARAKYNHAIEKNQRGIYQGITLFSPNINIFRDPRWGRGMETYGEDPYLTGEMGLRFIQGLQGDHDRYLKTIATPKHFAVHSGPEPERHTFNAVVREYDLRETYLPHFEKCILEGKANSIMCGYNRLYGDACCASELLIQEILRNEWDFEGVMVSDCWAVADIYNNHKIVDTPEEASAIAVRAGTDLECGNVYPSLIDAVGNGLITEEEIDTAVKRIFTARFKLGMFDPPEMDPFSALREVDSPEHRNLALEAARKSIVLLRNAGYPDRTSGNPLLPLRKDIQTIAIIGPNADDVESLLGNYHGFPSDPVTPLRGIKEKLPHADIMYEPGCRFVENIPSFEIVESPFLYTAADRKQQGLKGEYFDNRELLGEPAFTRTDTLIDFWWWDGSPDIPYISDGNRKNLDPENFGIRWTGVLVPGKSGQYALGGYGYNGYRIYLEDSLLIDYYSEFDPTKTYRSVDLQEGRIYNIKIEFYKTERYAFMQLIWDVPMPDRMQRAIDAAKKSDVVIMVMGLSPRLEGEALNVDIEGFRGGDRTSLDLPAPQSELIRSIHSLGKPVILVLLNGSALSITWEDENIPAIIEAWYPGQAGGVAIADVIWGDYNPGGRLPVTFYASVDQLPEFTDYDMNNRTYRYFKGKPLYPIGYGLSYTTFKYTNLRLDKSEIGPEESATLSVEITNTGDLKGEEVVQLYVKAGKDIAVMKSLKGFNRINFAPGKSNRVEFTITPETLSRWIDGIGFIVDSDDYTLFIGSSSSESDLQSIILRVK